MTDFNYDDHDDGVPTEVKCAVTEWIAETDDLLRRLHVAMELLHLESGLPTESRRMTDELLTVIRRLRDETPRPHAVATWLRALASAAGVRWMRGQARFMNAADVPPRGSPTGA